MQERPIADDSGTEGGPFILGDEEACSYLPGLRARFHYRLEDDLDPAVYEELLERGWRRFGRLLFRPCCAACQECRSLRVEVVAFRPSRSQQRCWRANQDLRVVVQPPRLSRQHLELYRRFHEDMEGRRGWRPAAAAPEEYYQTFVEGHGAFGWEMAFLHGEKLLAVALVDRLSRSLSSVYSYYDPEERRRGLGVYAVLCQIRWARQLGLPYQYLGYRVLGNPSMRYKAKYRPHQLLEGRPAPDEAARWLRPASPPDETPAEKPIPEPEL
jgi:arginine-tRNA-protein transferase